MKIIFDNIDFSIAKSSGVPIVWGNLIKRVQDNGDFNCRFIEIKGKTTHWVRKGLELGNVEIRNGQPQILRYFNPSIKEDKPFIFHSSYYRVCNNPNAINITTVHDFTYEYFRKGLPRIVHSWQKFNAIRKSDVVVCISENTKRDVLKFLPDVNPDTVKVVYNGVSDYYHPVETTQYNDLGRFILFVSGRLSYKRFDLAVDAAYKTGYKLVMVGSPLSKDETDLLNKRLGRDNYLCFSHIDDKTFNELYNSAFCLVYPSMYEGFGIPVIEAQKARCPVIAYNGSSIPEIIGDTPLLLSNPSSYDIISKLRMLDDNDIRNKIIKDGFLNAQRFSWDKMANEYMDIYRNAYNEKIHRVNLAT